MTGPKKSIIPVAAADDDGLNRTALRVLILLGGYADTNGKSWPSIPTMAERLGVSERFVQKSIRDLESRSYIERRAQFKDDGRQSSNSYHLAISNCAIGGEPPVQGGVNREFTQTYPIRTTQ